MVSTYGRRLQLLLDEHRFERVQHEANASGRSLAAVIREAIDLRFERDDDQPSRTAAARVLLESSVGIEDRPEPDWEERLADQEAELDRRLR